MSGGKMAQHATAPRYERIRRDKALRMARAERLQARQPRPQRPTTPSSLRHCPVCGVGLSARYRAPGAMHICRRRGCKEVCRWTP